MRLLLVISLVAGLCLALAGVAWAEGPKLDVRQAQVAPWWSDRDAGWIGGIGGSVLGCLGGLIGTLAGAGKARRLVLALVRALLVLGVVCLVAAGVALVSKQPYGVWYPLTGVGGISTLVMGGLLPGLRRRYEEIELRKMAAMDVGGGPKSAHPNGF